MILTQDRRDTKRQKQFDRQARREEIQQCIDRWADTALDLGVDPEALKSVPSELASALRAQGVGMAYCDLANHLPSFEFPHVEKIRGMVW